MVGLEEKHFKKGQVIYRAGDLDNCMYHILMGRVAVYMDYGLETQQTVLDLTDGDFLNVISFLEARPRNTTAVALAPTVVDIINAENFSDFFRKYPAKIVGLLQHMSARIRHLQKAYLDTCQALEDCADPRRLEQEEGNWTVENSRLYRAIRSLFERG